MSTSPSPSGTSWPHWPGCFRSPGVFDVDRANIRPEDLDGPDRVAHVVEQHVGGVEVDLQAWRLELVERESQQVGGLLAGLERQRDALGGGQLASLSQRLEHRRPGGVAGLGNETGVERQIAQAECDRAIERPLEPLDPLRPKSRVAEAAGGLDRLRRRVIFARETRAWRRS